MESFTGDERPVRICNVQSRRVQKKLFVFLALTGLTGQL